MTNRNVSPPAAPPPVEQPPGESEQDRSNEPRTYSQKELDQAVHAGKSEQGRELGRVTKEFDALRASFTLLESDHKGALSDISELEQRNREAESETWRDHPETLRIHQREDKVKEQLAKLIQREAALDDRDKKANERDTQHEDDLKELAGYRAKDLISEVVAEHGVDEKELLEAIEELGLDTPDKVRAYAKRKAGTSSTPEEESEPQVRPFSGRNVGGKDWRNLPPQEQIAYGKEQEKRKRK
jgi:hypothetical protein